MVTRSRTYDENSIASVRKTSRKARARVATYSGVVLITLVLFAMVVHLDQMHTDSDSAVTLAETWAFVGTYVIVPPGFAWIAVRSAATRR